MFCFTFKVAVTNAATEQQDEDKRHPRSNKVGLAFVSLLSRSSCKFQKCFEALILLKIGFFDHFLQSPLSVHLSFSTRRIITSFSQRVLSALWGEAIILQITSVMRATMEFGAIKGLKVKTPAAHQHHSALKINEIRANVRTECSQQFFWPLRRLMDARLIDSAAVQSVCVCLLCFFSLELLCSTFGKHETFPVLLPCLCCFNHAQNASILCRFNERGWQSLCCCWKSEWY